MMTHHTRDTEIKVDRAKADKDYAQMLIDKRNTKEANMKKHRDNNLKLKEQIEQQRIEAMKDGSDREKQLNRSLLNTIEEGKVFASPFGASRIS
jgi:hypothetical protein